MKKCDFYAIDFETANDERISACAIGIVKVVQNKIISENFYFIKPPEEINFSHFNIDIHGIEPSDVINESTFKELWLSKLKEKFENNLILFHNRSMDGSIIKQLLSHYKLDGLVHNVDTMEIAKKNDMPLKLVELTKKYNINFSNSHNATEDAKACALVGINMIKDGIDILNYKKTIDTNLQIIKKNKPTFIKGKAIPDKFRKQNENVKDKTNFFYGKRVVITGVFENISRYNISEKLYNSGAHISKTISGKIEYVIVGRDAGPSKLKKIDNYNLKGSNIIKLTEEEYLSKINKK